MNLINKIYNNSGFLDSVPTGRCITILNFATEIKLRWSFLIVKITKATVLFIELQRLNSARVYSIVKITKATVLFIKFFVSYHFFLKLMRFQPVIAYSNFDQ